MQEEVISRAFDQSFWLGVAVLLVVSQTTFLVFVLRNFWNKLQEATQEKDSLRDKYEAQQRDDLKLFLDVQNTLKDFQGGEVKGLMREIKTKVDQLLMMAAKG